LAELTIVVLIIGIFAAVGAPKYADSTALFRAEAAAKRIAADLKYARQAAMDQGVSKQVTFAVSSDSYSMPDVPDPDRSALAYVVDLSRTAYPASIVTVDFSGTAAVTFDRYGQPDSTGYVTVESSTYQYHVDVDGVTGDVTVQ
jgi:Tfp pilus assembly protein FimT